MDGNPGPVKRILSSISKLTTFGDKSPEQAKKKSHYPDQWGFWDDPVLLPSQNEAKVDAAFEAFRVLLFTILDQKRTNGSSEVFPAMVHREFGRINGGQRYFYIKAFNESGWLFERVGAGWTLSRAEKITERSLFVRHGQSFDRVSVLEASGSLERIRIRSEFWNVDHMSLDAYVAKNAKALGLNG
jgi:hypothetical protein